MDWVGLKAILRDAEDAEGPHGRRIVAVTNPASDVTVWHGKYGGAPVTPGAAGYTFSDGTSVTL